MKRMLMGVAIAAACAMPASAQQTANEKAYNITLTCQVIAAQFDDQPAFQKSVDAMQKMGRVLGYTSKKISDDVFAMTNVLGVRERNQPGALQTDRDGCRKIGLAS